MEIKIEQSWKTALATEFTKPYFVRLAEQVRAAYLLGQPPIYPPAPLIFNAFNHTPLDQVQVVLLGQDPYHGAGQAMGLSFSVPEGMAIPPSLQNIYKEITADIGTPSNTTGDLTPWAKQGVLLLNSTLTVPAGTAGRHQHLGWETFTDAVIKTISTECQHAVFLLWGNFAAKKASLIDQHKHLVLTAPHPSPLSAHRGFFGCQHFSKTNAYLTTHQLPPIAW